jgi:hypothetical protein
MKSARQKKQHILIIPGGLLAPGPHADPGCSATTHEVDGDLAQDGQITGGNPVPDAAVILAERDIQDPMETIFDTPYRTPRRRRLGTRAEPTGCGCFGLSRRSARLARPDRGSPGLQRAQRRGMVERITPEAWEGLQHFCQLCGHHPTNAARACTGPPASYPLKCELEERWGAGVSFAPIPAVQHTFRSAQHRSFKRPHRRSLAGG